MAEYPAPHVLIPLKRHTQTFIILHGRGSDGKYFGDAFYSSQLSSGKTLAQEFPGMKFIFPTASQRRAIIFNRTPIAQWFDYWSLEEITKRKELQYAGIRETSAYIHGIINAEAEIVGLRNVYLGGLSQGCAMSLHVMLNFLPARLSERSSLGGYIGMCGWLPLRDDLRETVFPDPNQGGEDDPFATADENSEDDTRPQMLQAEAANFARNVVDLPPLEKNTFTPPFTNTPFLLGHGTHDAKVKIQLGEGVRDVLVDLGLDVTYKEYNEGHWYKVPEQIDDIAEFLHKRIE